MLRLLLSTPVLHHTHPDKITNLGCSDQLAWAMAHVVYAWLYLEWCILFCASPLFWAVPVCITINEWAKCTTCQSLSPVPPDESILLLWELLVTFWRVGSLWSWPQGSCAQLCPNFADRNCVENERESVCLDYSLRVQPISGYNS
jgi:hypothetical protein